MNYLLNYYATDSNIAKPTFKIAALRNAVNETSIKFADVLKTKIVRCKIFYLEESTKDVFIDGFPANI